MSMRLKNAPNMKQQPKNAFEAVIFAGTMAFDMAKNYQETGRAKAEIELDEDLPVGASAPPVILFNDILENVDRYRIAPKSAQNVKIYRSDNDVEMENKSGLSSIQISAICANLARYTQAQDVKLFDGIGQIEEDLSAYVQRLRTDQNAVEMVEKITNSPSEKIELSANPSEREIVRHFLRWVDKPLGRDTTRSETLEFNGIYWQAVNDELLERKVIAFFDEMERDYSARKIASIASLAQKLAQAVEPQSTNLIGFQNGVIDKLTGQFLAHDTAHNLRAIEPYECNPYKLETPLFDDWLDFVSNGNEDRRQAILAGFYMILTNRHNWHLFLEITGIAGAGKSVMAEIAMLINGEQNTGVITLKDMEDPIKRGGLLNKSLAYSPDQGYYKGDGSHLKQITGNDPIDVKLLYLNPIKTRLGVVFMMTTNESMLFVDRNGGIERRRVIIPFDRVIPPMKKDVDFTYKVRLEVYGIINKILKRFPDPEEARRILQVYQAKNEGKETKINGSHLIAFCSYFEVSNDKPKHESLRLGSARKLYATKENPKTLYTAYALYCECVGQKELPVLAFKNALPDAFRSAGEKTAFNITTYNGYLTTNAYWKDKDAALKEWGAE